MTNTSGRWTRNRLSNQIKTGRKQQRKKASFTSDVKHMARLLKHSRSLHLETLYRLLGRQTSYVLSYVVDQKKRLHRFYILKGFQIKYPHPLAKKYQEK